MKPLFLGLPAWALLASALLAPAQQPSPTGSNPPSPSGFHVPKRQSFAETPAPHPSILRQRPWHEDFLPNNAQPGYRNPGGVGRFAEYYPAGDKFQNQSFASGGGGRIGLGGVPDRNEQLRSQEVGTGYYNMLMTHIDRYGSPRMGFGMGFGWGW